jgi:hypothetical protein
VRSLALVTLLVACVDAAPQDGPAFEFRLSFDRKDGTVIVNGAPFTGRLAFAADSYADAQTDIVLDVSAATATGTITTQLRPGLCATNVNVDRARIGPIVLEGITYAVVESTPPDLAVSSFVCEGINGGTASVP